MKKLLKNPLFLFIFGAIAATIIGYLINQLPAIPDFPYKTEILFISVFIFTMVAALVAYWQAQQQPEDAPPQIDSTIRPRLLEAEATKVKQRLQDSLHNLLMVDLLREEQPKQVGRKPLQTWCTVSVNNQTSQSQVLDRVVDIFRRDDIGGRLLILGQPGGGKTTTLLDLAQELQERAKFDNNEPLPIIFELSAWRDDNVSILDWLVQQLKQEYNLQPGIGRVWLERGEVLPLLDGLDELGLQQQRKCIRAINQYLQVDATRDLVVCCREEEYLAGEEQLDSLHGAICLQPLSDEQIRDYITDLQRGDLWESIQNNPEFLELARTPLLLSMMVVAYQGRAIETKEELFAAYIDRRFELLPVEKGEKRRQIIHYLRFLAQRLKETQTEFLIENMQPSWLQHRRHKLIYRLIQGLIFGLITGLSAGIDWKINGDINIGITIALALAIIVLVLFQKKDKNIELVEVIRFNFLPKKIQDFLIEIHHNIIRIIWLPRIFVFGIPIVVLTRLLFALTGTDVQLIIIIIIALLIIAWLINVLPKLIHSLKDEIVDKSFPNQGIWYSAKSMIAAVLIYTLPILFIGLFVWFNFYDDREFIQILLQEETGLKYPILFFVFQVFDISGGSACIQHFSLRLVLYCNGYIPWNYAKFLSRAAERRFIQQVGGRYRFIHRLLLDHFAGIEV